jgi:hypothetical protein
MRGVDDEDCAGDVVIYIDQATGIYNDADGAVFVFLVEVVF